MKCAETDRYGKPLKEIKLDEVIKELQEFPPDVVLALCASFIVVHEPYTWENIYKKIKEDLIKKYN